MSDLDIDLLAPVEPSPRRRPSAKSLPSTSDADDRPVPTHWTADDIDDDDPDALLILNGGWPDASAFIRPVGVTFIGTVLGIEPRRLHKKLKNCPVIGRGTLGRGKGQPLYDFKEAMQYCVDPRIDLKTWFSSLSTTTMPPIISKAFWEAIRVKNKVMEEAGDYWHTEDVLRVFGEVNMLIKDTSLLWLEELPGKASISTEDYHALSGQVKALLNTIAKTIGKAQFEKQSRSIVAAIENDIETGLLDRLGGGE